MKKLAIAAVIVLAACGTKKDDTANMADTTITPTMTADTMADHANLVAHDTMMAHATTMARDTAKMK